MAAKPVLYIPELTLADEGLIAALWRRGCNTKEIAQHLRLREFTVANRLPDILRTVAGAA
jgi:DNA-binding NarL/FixJ family response regulator